MSQEILTFVKSINIINDSLAIESLDTKPVINEPVINESGIIEPVNIEQKLTHYQKLIIDHPTYYADYYLKRKMERKICDCGGNITFNHLSRHNKGVRHMKFMNMNKIKISE